MYQNEHSKKQKDLNSPTSVYWKELALNKNVSP